LALGGAAGGLEVVAEPVALALDPFHIPPQALVLLPQALDLPRLLADSSNQLLAGLLRQPPRHRHGSKKAYLSPRIYNALRREALTKDDRPSEPRPGLHEAARGTLPRSVGDYASHALDTTDLDADEMLAEFTRRRSAGIFVLDLARVQAPGCRISR
jgi:hypothetical protein